MQQSTLRRYRPPSNFVVTKVAASCIDRLQLDIPVIPAAECQLSNVINRSSDGLFLNFVVLCGVVQFDADLAVLLRFKIVELKLTNAKILTGQNNSC